ncbi:cyclic nucleotide-binding domain-containing protein, partial [Legionella sp.]|uniref:cyclic nucleotide-binding domain-containing protein n=1 Tax=Legionella sp. TaxID=459 RepID=UPI00321FF611
MDIAITLAFLLAQIILLVSYLMTSMLFLRALVCVAQVFFTIATLMLGLYQPGMLSSFIFSVLILFINMLHIYRLLYAQIPFNIPEKYKTFYREKFSHFLPREFMILMKYAKTNSINDDYLIYENSIAEVSVIIEGNALILAGENRVAELGKNSIIGEISFLTGSTSIASVKAINSVNFCSWSRENLLKIKKRYPSIYYKFYDLLINSASTKLRDQNTR